MSSLTSWWPGGWESTVDGPREDPGESRRRRRALIHSDRWQEAGGGRMWQEEGGRRFLEVTGGRR